MSSDRIKMPSNLTCVFKCNDVPGKTLKFSADNLEECRKKLHVRVVLELKYKEVILPKCVNNVDGYHSSCRKNFMAIPKKYMDKYLKIPQVPPPCANASGPSGKFHTLYNLIHS